MHTERVTFLTTPDHKAALDAFAASSGRSVEDNVMAILQAWRRPRPRSRFFEVREDPAAG